MAAQAQDRIACGILYQREDILNFYERLIPRQGLETTCVEEVRATTTPGLSSSAARSRASRCSPRRLDDTPALIVSNLGEVLVQNRMADALFGDKSGYTGLARSEIYRWFTDPAERLRYPADDRDRQSRAQVANLRAAYGSMGPQSRAGELVRALQKAHAEFAGLWARHEVAKRFEDHKILIHPELGPIELTARCCLPRINPRRCWCSPRPRAPRATRISSCWPCWVTSASPSRGPASERLTARLHRQPGGGASAGCPRRPPREPAPTPAGRRASRSAVRPRC